MSFDLEKWKVHRDNLVMRFRELKYVEDPVKLKESVTEACIYLEDTSIDLLGYKIWGSPWTPWFHDWGFNSRRGPECKSHWDKIPDDTDIILTHGPPLAFGDRCDHGGYAGCLDLLEAI